MKKIWNSANMHQEETTEDAYFHVQTKQIKKLLGEHLTRKGRIHENKSEEQEDYIRVKEDVKEFDKTNILRE